MKTIHEWNEDLENKLMFLNDDELNEWFKNNTINWENDLTNQIKNDKLLNNGELNNENF